MHTIRIILSVLCFALHSFSGQSQKLHVSTDLLVKRFHDAWNREDMEELYDLLDSTAFFKSPFQLRYSRDTMRATVLITNPPIFKVVEQKETYSKIKGDLAWSIGTMVSDVYDRNGVKQEEPWQNDYVYLFIRRENQWKLQMLFFHE